MKWRTSGYPNALRDLIAECMGEMIHFRRLTNVRFYVQTLPRALRDVWLDVGATQEDVWKAVGFEERWWDVVGTDKWHHDHGSFDRWAKKGMVNRGENTRTGWPVF
jgi:hypothetical protein